MLIKLIKSNDHIIQPNIRSKAFSVVNSNHFARTELLKAVYHSRSCFECHHSGHVTDRASKRTYRCKLETNWCDKSRTDDVEYELEFYVDCVESLEHKRRSI